MLYLVDWLDPKSYGEDTEEVPFLIDCGAGPQMHKTPLAVPGKAVRPNLPGDIVGYFEAAA